jgi:hypothetical protein
MESHPSCSVYGTSYVYCDQSGVTRIPVLRGVPSGDWTGVLSNYFRVASMSDPPLWSSAIAIRKDALKSIGGFPVGIKAGEDLLTWTRLALNYRIAYSTRPCSVFHLRSEIGGLPTRIPETPDRVGEALHRLVEGVDPSMRRDLKRYVAFWHRMRAAMFLHLGSRSHAFRDLGWIARYNFLSPQLYLYGGLLMLPSTARQKALALLTSLKTRRRKALSHG